MPCISLQQLELFLLDLPQKTIFQSSIGTRKSKESLIVKWTDREGRVGYGECSCRPDPYYSDEFLAASLKLIEEFVVPHLKAEQDHEDVMKVLGRIRGWNFTKAAVEAAMFQILRQQGDFSLEKEIQANPTKKVPVGISLGIYHDIGSMREVVQEAIDEGYERIKFKIAPHVDTDLFEQINPLLFDNKVYVSFDANGSYTEGNLDKLGYFANTYPNAIEQPTPPHRFDMLVRAKALFPDMKVCFDEEVKGMGDLVKLHALGVMDELNLKPGRVGGLRSSIEMLNYCHTHAIDCWVGGMFETGIGRLHNLEIASFLPQARAHDMSPSSRYFKEDIVAPEVQMTDGHIEVASALQSQVLPERMERYATHKEVISF
ncbi:MAG: o-succinylbenzoate synthase [Bacteroidia bacterium]